MRLKWYAFEKKKPEAYVTILVSDGCRVGFAYTDEDDMVHHLDNGFIYGTVICGDVDYWSYIDLRTPYTCYGCDKHCVSSTSIKIHLFKCPLHITIKIITDRLSFRWYKLKQKWSSLWK